MENVKKGWRKRLGQSRGQSGCPLLRNRDEATSRQKTARWRRTAGGEARDGNGRRGRYSREQWKGRHSPSAAVSV